MPAPQISAEDVARILPDLQNVQFLAQGGQKTVFSCEIEGEPLVIKFLLVEESASGNGQSAAQVADRLSEVTSRALREINTMEQIDIPTLVKLGPIRLTPIVINGQQLIYYTEEKIDGKDLKALFNERGVLTIDEIKCLGCDVVTAIDNLWQIKRIHRDIKPGNIMLRNDIGRFVLLDMGMVFDLGDISLTPPPIIMGTLGYHSPEQLLYEGRRSLDFRSDLFSLGVVLYESSTGINPFTCNCSNNEEIMSNTQRLNPQRPSLIRSEIPDSLDEIVLRMLSKQPHLRYNSCIELINRLQYI